MSDEPTATVALPPPAPDQAYMNVSALEAGNLHLPIHKFVANTKPEIVSCPSLAFLLRHSKTGHQIVFDLGTRRDVEAYPPATHEQVKSSAGVTQDVVESLEKGGISPNEVDAVIISHLHWDQ